MPTYHVEMMEGRTAEHLHADAGDLFDQLALLLDGAAFHHLDVVSGHGFSLDAWAVEKRLLCR